jgi:hypothetical protein
VPYGGEFLGNVQHTIAHAVGGWQKGLGHQHNAHGFKIRTRSQHRAIDKQHIDEQLAEIWYDYASLVTIWSACGGTSRDPRSTATG